MRRILVTNDDGYRSEGIKALADAVAHLGDVTIVAPVTEASAISGKERLMRRIHASAARFGETNPIRRLARRWREPLRRASRRRSNAAGRVRERRRRWPL